MKAVCIIGSPRENGSYIDGKCIQNDDVEQMVINILTADIVLIATPSYWGDVTGQLKTFLIGILLMGTQTQTGSFHPLVPKE